MTPEILDSRGNSVEYSFYFDSLKPDLGRKLIQLFPGKYIAGGSNKGAAYWIKDTVNSHEAMTLLAFKAIKKKRGFEFYFFAFDPKAVKSIKQGARDFTVEYASPAAKSFFFKLID